MNWKPKTAKALESVVRQYVDGSPESLKLAVINGYVVLERAVKNQLREEGIEVPNNSIVHILKDYKEQFRLEPDTINRIDHFRATRNAAAHDDDAPPPAPELVRRFIELSFRFLDQQGIDIAKAQRLLQAQNAGAQRPQKSSHIGTSSPERSAPTPIAPSIPSIAETAGRRVNAGSTVLVGVLALVFLIVVYALTRPNGPPPPPPPQPVQPVQIDYNPSNLVSIEAIQFFEAGTSNPLVWYHATAEGMYELFDKPGRHPRYKTELKPITRGIVDELRRRASTAVIFGVVTDTNGRAVVGARVEATNVGKEVASSRLTNAAGMYRFERFSDGHYVLAASASGFRSSASTEVELQPAQSVRMDLSLERTQPEREPIPPRGQPGTNTAGSDPRPTRPHAFVVASDDSGSPWTTEITLEEIERGLLVSPGVQTLRRSELPRSVDEELSALGPQDVARLVEIARGLNATHVVLGTCVEAREDAGRLRITVRLQILDVHTGEITHSEGHDGWGYLQVDRRENLYRKSLRGIANLFFSGRPKLTLH